MKELYYDKIKQWIIEDIKQIDKMLLDFKNSGVKPTDEEAMTILMLTSRKTSFAQILACMQILEEGKEIHNMEYEKKTDLPN